MGEYWQTRVRFQAGNELLNLKVHRAEEVRREDWLLRRCRPTPVVYIHAKPILMASQPTLTIELFNQPSIDGAIGKVAGVHEGDLIERNVGSAQAWVFVEHNKALL